MELKYKYLKYNELVDVLCYLQPLKYYNINAGLKLTEQQSTVYFVRWLYLHTRPRLHFAVSHKPIIIIASNLCWQLSLIFNSDNVRI